MREEDLAKLVNTNMTKLEITNKFGLPDNVMAEDDGFLFWHFFFKPDNDGGPRRFIASGLSTVWKEERMVRWSPIRSTTGGKNPSEFLKPIESAPGETVAKGSTNRSVSFWLVSKDRIEGGRYIDIGTLPKLGWIAKEPNLRVTRLKYAEAGHEPVNYDGKGLREDYQFNLGLIVDDAEAFGRLTQENLGKQILLMVGNEPMMAPRVNGPINSGRFTISTYDPKQFEELRTAFAAMIVKE